MRQIIVQKYGGVAVATTERIQAIADHIQWTIKEKNASIVVAISAMGDQTDQLLELAASISGTPPKRELDMLLSAGERISMSLLAIALDSRGVTTLSLTGSQSGILTDEYHGNARIHHISGERIRSGISQGHVVIVAGFQGVSPKTKDITTLGRGGTDLTAVALACYLNADRCELYKDVSGIFSCDPKLTLDSRLISRLSWRSLADLTWGGAGIIHPRVAHLAQKYKVRLQINSFLNPKILGTEVFGENTMEQPTLFAVTSKKNQILFTVSKCSQDLLESIVAWLWEHEETPLVNSVNGSECIVSMRDDLAHGIGSLIPGGISTSKSECCEIITVVGSGLFQSPEYVKEILTSVKDLSPLYLNYSNDFFRVALAKPVAQTGVTRLHQFISRSTPNDPDQNVVP